MAPKAGPAQMEFDRRLGRINWDKIEIACDLCSPQLRLRRRRGRRRRDRRQGFDAAADGQRAQGDEEAEVREIGVGRTWMETLTKLVMSPGSDRLLSAIPFNISSRRQCFHG